MSEKAGWESHGLMESRVLEEIVFWIKNLRRLNGWRMQDTEDIVYCREGLWTCFPMRQIFSWPEQGSRGSKYAGTRGSRFH